MIYGVDEAGIKVEISFVTDKEPTQENIEKIEKILESSKKEKSLVSYYSNVKFIRAEVITKGVNNYESNDKSANER